MAEVEIEIQVSLEELKAKLAVDPVLRAKYTANAIAFWESNGVKVTETMLKSFDNDAIVAVTGGGGGGTNIIAVF